jgi:S1-C subfamily serine protease
MRSVHGWGEGKRLRIGNVRLKMTIQKSKNVLILWLCGMAVILGGCGKDSLQSLEEDLARVTKEAGPSVVSIIAKNESSGEVKFGSGVILNGGFILTTENILTNTDNITLKLALGNTDYSKGLDISLGTITKSWIGGADAYDESLMIWHGPVIPYHGGTPIFNRKGELLGLTEGKPKEENGVIFILPAKTCLRVSELLQKQGKVERAWIGIYCETATGSDEKTNAAAEGVLVTKVIEGSPAYQAGLIPGDRILSFNGKQIDDPSQLRKLVTTTGVGSHILLSLIRKKENKKTDVVVKTCETDGLGMRRCPHRSI